VSVVVALAALTAFASPVSANHWCSPSAITYSPKSGYPGDSPEFIYHLENNVADALTVQGFYVQYSWKAPTYDLGPATVPGYGFYPFYDNQILPATAGSYTIAISVDGYAGGDFYATTCYYGPVSFDVLSYSAPTVIASANPTSGAAPLTVSFSATVSNGLAPFTYSWTFGDGVSGSGQTTSHTYTSAGTYTTQVIVTDSRSNTAANSVAVAITAPLSVTVGADVTSGTIPVAVTFGAAVSGGTAPYTFAWDFKDGGSSALQNPTHTFQAAATYVVAVVVTDAAGRSVTRTVTVTANPSPLLGSGQGVPPWALYTVGFVVAAVAIALGIRMRRKKRLRPPERAGTPPPSMPPQS